ncbi:MFS general substrate transporter [Thermothelomyces heterothallicus CBS 203.75]
MSFLFVPAVAVVSRRLPHRRGLALGIVVGGSALGGVIWPIMLNQLLNHNGVSFGWSMRFVAFTMIPLLAVTCLTVVDGPNDRLAVRRSQDETKNAVVENRPRNEEAGPKTAGVSIATGTDGDAEVQAVAVKPEAPARSSKTDLSILKSHTYILLSIGLFFTYLGLFTPLFYISRYAISQGVSESTSFYLLAALNACSFFGRVIPGYLADYYGHYNIQVICILLAAIIGFCLTATTNPAGLIVWTLAYGFASGTVIALQNACAGKIAPQQSQGAAVGFVTAITSIP